MSCDSASVRLVRAADIVANRLYHLAVSDKICNQNRDYFFISFFALIGGFAEDLLVQNNTSQSEKDKMPLNSQPAPVQTEPHSGRLLI